MNIFKFDMKDPFEDKIKKGLETECWEWQGALNNGYGSYKGQGSHRIAWARKNRPIPSGYEIHHKCKNRACCNPDHLQCLKESDHKKLHGKLNTKRAKKFEMDGFSVMANNRKHAWFIVKAGELYDGTYGIIEELWTEGHRKRVKKLKKRYRKTDPNFSGSTFTTGNETTVEMIRRMNLDSTVKHRVA